MIYVCYLYSKSRIVGSDKINNIKKQDKPKPIDKVDSKINENKEVLFNKTNTANVGGSLITLKRKKQNKKRTEYKGGQRNKKKDMNWVKLTDEFKNILSKINNRKDNYFITGKAGTGKSTLLKYLYNTTQKKCVLLAPTGIAAINMGGQTIHSFFKLDWGILQPSDYFDKPIPKAKHIDIIIIDEISMVRSDILDSIDKIMQATMENQQPFGGKQVLFFGDPYQLSPIVPEGENIQEYFSDYYKSEYFFDSKVYDKAMVKCIELDSVFRQKNLDFVEVLNKIRNGSCTEDHLAFINSRVKEYEFENNDKIILTPYKAKATHINQQGLMLLNTPIVEFNAELEGKIKSKNIPAEELLILKEGAKVMFVKNNRPSWVNGTLGTVEKILDEKVIVRTGISTYTVERVTWEEYKYKYNEQTQILEKEVVGKFTQIPLILAWAITIHKGQGTTLDAAHIDLDKGAFTYGQTYVALSRTRKLSEMSLQNNIMKTDIRVDQRIIDFYDSVDWD